MCNQDCNQGRSCDCEDSGESASPVIALIIVAGVAISLLCIYLTL